MPNRRSRAIGLAAILCLLGLLAFVSWPPDRPHPPSHTQTRNQGNTAGPNKEQQQEDGKTFWHRTARDPVALFTAALTLFTAVLAFVSCIQFYFVIRADKTARAAAEGLSKIERAYLFIQVAFQVPGDKLTIGGWRTRAVVTVSNYGRTPGMPEAITVGLAFLPDAPHCLTGSKMTEMTVPPGLVVANGDPYTFNVQITISDRDGAEFDAADKDAFCFGLVRYRDVLGAARETGFCWQASRRMGPAMPMLVFISDNTPLNRWS